MPRPRKYATEEERIQARRAARSAWAERNPGSHASYVERNRQHVNAKNAAYRAANPEKVKAWHERYRRNNPEKYRQVARDYAKRRYWSDGDYRLKVQLRSRLSKTVDRGSDVTAAISNCGCTFSELRDRIQQQFQPGMSWENRSAWHIDHIYPLCAIDKKDRRHVLAVCNWRNLRPVWADENWKKNKTVTPEAVELFEDILSSIPPEEQVDAAEV